MGAERTVAILPALTMREAGGQLLLLADGHLAEVGDNGRPYKRGDHHPEKGGEQRWQ